MGAWGLVGVRGRGGWGVEVAGVGGARHEGDYTWRGVQRCVQVRRKHVGACMPSYPPPPPPPHTHITPTPPPTRPCPLQVIKVPVGNIADLRTVTVEEIGGVPVRELQRSIRDLRGGRLTGFVQPADPGSAADLMPPNAPSVPNWEGNRVGPPPFLEDLEVELQVGPRPLPARLPCAPAPRVCVWFVVCCGVGGGREGVGEAMGTLCGQMAGWRREEAVGQRHPAAQPWGASWLSQLHPPSLPVRPPCCCAAEERGRLVWRQRAGCAGRPCGHAAQPAARRQVTGWPRPSAAARLWAPAAALVPCESASAARRRFDEPRACRCSSRQLCVAVRSCAACLFLLPLLAAAACVLLDSYSCYPLCALRSPLAPPSSLDP